MSQTEKPNPIIPFLRDQLDKVDENVGTIAPLLLASIVISVATWIICPGTGIAMLVVLVDVVLVANETVRRAYSQDVDDITEVNWSDPNNYLAWKLLGAAFLMLVTAWIVGFKMEIAVAVLIVAIATTWHLWLPLLMTPSKPGSGDGAAHDGTAGN